LLDLAEPQIKGVEQRSASSFVLPIRFGTAIPLSVIPTVVAGATEVSAG
jgi:hypothetical protein